MTETDRECGHTKTTLRARGVNEILKTFFKSRKIVTFYHLNSTNFDDNFKDKLQKLNFKYLRAWV